MILLRIHQIKLKVFVKVHLFLFTFLNMATRKFQIPSQAHFLFLLDSAALGHPSQAVGSSSFDLSPTCCPSCPLVLQVVVTPSWHISVARSSGPDGYLLCALQPSAGWQKVIWDWGRIQPWVQALPLISHWTLGRSAFLLEVLNSSCLK